AGGVDDHEVAEVLAQVLSQARGDRLRVLPVVHLEDRHADLLAQGAELLAPGRALCGGCHHQHPASRRLVLVRPLPRGGGLPGAPICWPKVRSCSRAAGRCVSAATINTRRPCAVYLYASFPAVVVLPAPCRPINSQTLPSERSVGWTALPPRTSTSSSCTMAM